MSVKYHISPMTGKPEKCTATKRPCKYGGPEVHFSSKAIATEVAEQLNKPRTYAHHAMLHKQPKSSTKPAFDKEKFESLSDNLRADANSGSMSGIDSMLNKQASSKIDEILEEYHNNDFRKDRDVIAYSRMVELRDACRNYQLNDHPDNITVARDNIANTITDALPGRLKKDLFGLEDETDHMDPHAVETRRTPAFRRVRTTLKNLSDAYSNALSKEPNPGSSKSYDFSYENIQENIKTITNATSAGKPDDDTVLTARMVEYRNNCIDNYDDDMRRLRVVECLNDGLPEELRRDVPDYD